MPKEGCGAACLVRGVPARRRDDLRAAASAGLVLAAVAAGLPVWSRSAVPCPAPDSDQSWPLADGGGAVSGGQERVILAVHVRGLDGMCAGCRAWWSRLTPYPCWQVDWATSQQARTITARFLEGVR
ncbi:hypothetical protein ONA91_38390 [Micromonospora sp. DR5-3]|uniref:hypothetical protein n=1 Tax=unclassified Micromonospora TaxID=2617518 RepID=UPI0011D34177|nr:MULTISPECIES: hypothetical protein [unclassified Micromonospora]MCW3820316.1 hypothetical protein [Micromonospora sp. DR5-3]TYC19612.1 hypothetical protein FXF52_35765 [Micromonospora sp. MP36]